MPREVNLGALWEEPFATSLATPRQSRASAFGAHPCTKTVLLFSRSLGRLVGALHTSGKGAGKLVDESLSVNVVDSWRARHVHCQSGRFME